MRRRGRGRGRMGRRRLRWQWWRCRWRARSEGDGTRGGGRGAKEVYMEGGGPFCELHLHGVGLDLVTPRLNRREVSINRVLCSRSEKKQRERVGVAVMSCYSDCVSASSSNVTRCVDAPGTRTWDLLTPGRTLHQSSHRWGGALGSLTCTAHRLRIAAGGS